MPYVKIGEENDADIELYYEDHGTGRPVVLSHGYPLSGQAWEKQVRVLLDAGYRVITYDRRGWGGSSQPGIGYDYDTFASDANELFTALDLHDAVYVGHSMGTGDVTRYVGRYGTSRLVGAVLVSPIPPFFLQAEGNPMGPPQSLFDGFKAAVIADRPAWMKGFLDNFYNSDVYLGSRVSEQAFQASFNIAVAGSPIAAVECVDTWTSDFRPDVAKFDIPVLVVQGDQDRVLPIDLTGNRLKDLIQDLTFVTVKDGPHGIPWTHAEEVTEALLQFIAAHPA
jgi:pimeloyl-ACP methyl ester carboxylesterase